MWIFEKISIFAHFIGAGLLLWSGVVGGMLILAESNNSILAKITAAIYAVFFVCMGFLLSCAIFWG